MATPIYISFHIMLGLLGIRSGFAVMPISHRQAAQTPPVLFFAPLFFPFVFLVTTSV
jgi:hypothetical protein